MVAAFLEGHAFQVLIFGPSFSGPAFTAPPKKDEKHEQDIWPAPTFLAVDRCLMALNLQRWIRDSNFVHTAKSDVRFQRR